MLSSQDRPDPAELRINSHLQPDIVLESLSVVNTKRNRCIIVLFCSLNSPERCIEDGLHAIAEWSSSEPAVN
ncbi:hypothetical protein AALO_G00258150 [Alosa alosa]|uniref:Uncharacterized protein n=1 Tax=Alosa alosa TaxID=278164 RepID=A0AAV6FUC4_9TELE|nr:hypothetical protein AALO_G00258150 [Alosa alosa]